MENIQRETKCERVQTSTQCQSIERKQYVYGIFLQRRVKAVEATDSDMNKLIWTKIFHLSMLSKFLKLIVSVHSVLKLIKLLKVLLCIPNFI